MPADQKRRDFLKTAAAASAIGMTATTAEKSFAQTTSSELAWTPGMQINPAIDNKRVICCYDTNMLTQTPPNTSWANQNNYVSATTVDTNLDQMAMYLTGQSTATAAWSTIFRSSKPWASTTVAIKTNGISGLSGNHPRVAIIKKICDVFIDQLGVPAANIVLYDATDDASIVYASYASLTDSTKMRCVVSVLAGSLGGYTPVTIVNSDKSAGSVQCVADLANGVTDILVNVSVCKVHNGPGNTYGYGSVTMCLKNHLGTFNNAPGHAEPMHVLAAIMEINQHQAILGGNPVRQQLCIVDALLCSSQSPGGSWDTRYDRIAMGTFAPMVDYTCGMNLIENGIRAGSPVTNLLQNIPTFLTSFGYTTTDPQWTEYTPGQGSVDAGGIYQSGSSSGGSTSSSSGSSTSSSGGSSTSSSGGKSSSSGGKSSSSGSGSTSSSGTTSGGSSTSSSGTTSGGSSTSSSGTTSGGGSTSSSNGGGSTSSSNGGSSTSSSGGLAASSSGGLAASSSGGTTGSSTGGTGLGSSTSGSPAGSSGGSTSAGAAPNGGDSGGGGCDVAGVDRRATPWGALLAVGAVVAGTLGRRTSRSPGEGESGKAEEQTSDEEGGTER
jgi:hypothetical protein